jgi:tetratricopeptide (TPR) repeat protein
MDILILLTVGAGGMVSKEALIEGAWRGVAVTDNSLVKAIAGLRQALGTHDSGGSFIETVAGRGYRLLATVERSRPPLPDETFAAMLDPDRAFVKGRAALEMLDLGEVALARDAFAEALRAAPDLAAAHIGMANACALAFESTRTDRAQDLAALEMAEQHAREGCQRDPSSAEAWGTLAFVLHRKGDGREALAAAQKAVTLEPGIWRHHLRLASVSWGDERVRAAHRVIKLSPGTAFGYWFMATVFVARQAFDAALEALRAGCAAQDAQRREAGRFHGIGLHLLHGLVLAARGAVDTASEELVRELSATDEGHVYARECRANTWYAIGALRLRANLRDEAEMAFHEALAHVPGHGYASAALAAMSHACRSAPGPLRTRAAPALHSGPPPEHASTGLVEAAAIQAIGLTMTGNLHDAARVCAEAIARAPEPSAGWLLPVDPILCPTAHKDAWAPTLALLHERAL